MEEASLIAYDEGDHYVLSKVCTKQIVRSRKIIFNENPSKELPDPAYDLNIEGLHLDPARQEISISERHVPVDLLNNPFDFHDFEAPSYASPLSCPPPPSVEDTHEEDIPRNNLLSTNPALFEEVPWSRQEEMAGSSGRYGEAQREDAGVHFEVGGSGALVEPQSPSWGPVSMDPTPMESTPIDSFPMWSV